MSEAEAASLNELLDMAHRTAENEITSARSVDELNKAAAFWRGELREISRKVFPPKPREVII